MQCARQSSTSLSPELHNMGEYGGKGIASLTHFKIMQALNISRKPRFLPTWFLFLLLLPAFQASKTTIMCFLLTGFLCVCVWGGGAFHRCYKHTLLPSDHDNPPKCTEKLTITARSFILTALMIGSKFIAGKNRLGGQEEWYTLCNSPHLDSAISQTNFTIYFLLFQTTLYSLQHSGMHWACSILNRCVANLYTIITIYQISSSPFLQKG